MILGLGVKVVEEVDLLKLVIEVDDQSTRLIQQICCRSKLLYCG
jgi:hypothetical protein